MTTPVGAVERVCICCGFRGPRHLFKRADSENFAFRRSWICRNYSKCCERGSGVSAAARTLTAPDEHAESAVRRNGGVPDDIQRKHLGGGQ